MTRFIHMAQGKSNLLCIMSYLRRRNASAQQTEQLYPRAFALAEVSPI